jgi:hypothetical protein
MVINTIVSRLIVGLKQTARVLPPNEVNATGLDPEVVDESADRW